MTYAWLHRVVDSEGDGAGRVAQVVHSALSRDGDDGGLGVEDEDGGDNDS
jgi:hypothetical protein